MSPSTSSKAMQFEASETCNRTPKLPNKRQKQKTTTFNKYDDAIEQILKMPPPEMNENIAFGTSIAIQLNKLSELNAARTRMKIQQVLTEVRVAELELMYN